MYTVRCKLVNFDGDVEKAPCHIGYEIGDEIYYDGAYFTGKVCGGLMLAMVPVVYGVHVLGHKYSENTAFRYRGLDQRDPSMAKYDGVGMRPVKKGISDEGKNKRPGIFPPVNSKTGKARGAHFTCADTRTMAHFMCEPVDLSDTPNLRPFYYRAMSLLYKIEAEPGIKVDDILSRFTDFEREDISPPLTPVLRQVLMEALEDMDYITIEEGKATATGREPPRRPKIG